MWREAPWRARRCEGDRGVVGVCRARRGEGEFVAVEVGVEGGAGRRRVSGGEGRPDACSVSETRRAATGCGSLPFVGASARAGVGSGVR